MTPEEQLKVLQEKFHFLVAGVHQGRLHLETLFGDFETIHFGIGQHHGYLSIFQIFCETKFFGQVF